MPVGRIVGLAGAACCFLFLAATLLPWLGDESVWEASSRGDVLVLLLILATAALLVLASLLGSRMAAVVAAVPASFTLGLVIAVDAPLDALGIGHWLLAFFGLIVVASAVVAALSIESSEQATATGTPAVAPSSHPTGWYPDPAGRAAERYWSGSDWTEHTR